MDSDGSNALFRHSIELKIGPGPILNVLNSHQSVMKQVQTMRISTGITLIGLKDFPGLVSSKRKTSRFALSNNKSPRKHR